MVESRTAIWTRFCEAACLAALTVVLHIFLSLSCTPCSVLMSARNAACDECPVSKSLAMNVTVLPQGQKLSFADHDGMVWLCADCITYVCSSNKQLVHRRAAVAAIA